MSIGEVLAAARRESGLTISEVSQETRIRGTIVREIERDDFSGCGGDFYARGHVRAIARAVGTDPEPLVRDYDASHAPPEPSPAADAAEEQPAAPFRPREHRQPNWTVALLLVLVVIVGLVVYHVVASHPADHAAAAGGSGAPTHKAATTPPAATSPTTPPASPGAVTISLTTVTESCWVDLTTSSGTTIFQGVMGLGTSKSWTERQAVTLKLGNPGAVTLTVDGSRRTGLGSDPVTLSLGSGQPTSG